MRFTATLTNPKPPGAIETRGEFGPWAAGEPGDTPLRGAYTFAHADLGVFKGIDGDLTLGGRYSGVLERIGVRGKTVTPNFTVTVAGNPVALSTAFNAIVDGTNGNTWLDPVNATLPRFDDRGARRRRPRRGRARTRSDARRADRSARRSKICCGWR